MEAQRATYESMCRAFFAGYPDGVSASDHVIPNGDHDLPIRQYHKARSDPQAHVVYYHGGGFVVGGLDSHDDICAEICDRTGFDVTSVDYRLAPEHRFPDDFHDAVCGFEHVSGTGLPVVLVGDSAGGNLAAAVSGHMRHHARAPIGQVLIYPGLGSDFTKDSFVEHEHAPMLTLEETKFYKTMRTGGDDTHFSDPRCMPLADTDFSNLPLTVVVSAQCDPLFSDAAAYCNAITDAGGRAIWFNETGLVHGYLRARHRAVRARDSFTRIITAICAVGHGDWPY